MQFQTDRNLLFGVLALQTEAISQDQLVTAMHAWVADKTRSLAECLVEQGALNQVHHDALNALVGARIEAYDNSPAKTLAHLHSAVAVRDALADIDDPDVKQTLGFVSSHVSTNGPTATAPSTPQPKTQAGRFKIIRFHDEGGLGNVYVAEDTELGREVALKELKKKTADDPVSRNRFVAEAEITGGLEHPGIVPVYGLGHYEDGRPYYAMRFIKGDNLNRKIREYHEKDWSQYGGQSAKNMELRRLLTRFMDVCQAVHYAHKRGVLHRDIKPGNIMIGQYGETLVVDWGLAKWLGQRPESSKTEVNIEDTLLPPSDTDVAATMLGSAVGTPAFMSPEQARGEHQNLGPATDIFSLGATLYYLLTNHSPYEGHDDVLAAARQGKIQPPRTHHSGLPRPLESICLKALSAETSNRYGSAKALAEDVEQFLGNEVVLAHEETVVERLGRLSRRYRAWVGAASIALALVSTASLLAAGVASSARKQAELSERRTSRVLNYLVEALRSPDPSIIGRNVKVADVLDTAIAQLDPQLADDPICRALLLDHISTTYFRLGLYASAEKACRRAMELHSEYGETDSTTIKSMANLGAILLRLGRPAEAQGLLRKAVDEYCLSVEEFDSDRLDAEDNLGLAVFELGKAESAADIFENTYEIRRRTLGAEHPSTLNSMCNFAMAQQRLGNTVRAVQLLEECHALHNRSLGEQHPQSIVAIGRLAEIYVRNRQFEKGIELYEECLRLSRNVLGESHPQSQMVANNLGWALYEGGHLEAAIERFEAVLPIHRAKLGHGHVDTLRTTHNLAKALIEIGDLDRGIECYELLLKTRREFLGDNHDATQHAAGELIQAYLWRNRYALAKDLAMRWIDQFDPELVGQSLEHQLRLLTLAEAELGLGEVRKAITLITDALRVLESKNPSSVESISARGLLGRAYIQDGRADEGVRLVLGSQEQLSRRLDELGRRRAMSEIVAAECSALLLEKRGRTGEARGIHSWVDRVVEECGVSNEFVDDIQSRRERK